MKIHIIKVRIALVASILLLLDLQTIYAKTKKWIHKHDEKHQHDKNGFAGAILNDLCEAFDAIKHDLLIEKLHAYGFAKNALDLVYSYLKNKSKERRWR